MACTHPQQYLDALTARAIQSSFLHHIVRQIESIQFAVDWKMQDRVAGSRKFKSQFMKMAFASQSGRTLPLVLTAPQDQREFEKFKVRQNHAVTLRTYLHDLYVEVSRAVVVIFASNPCAVWTGSLVGPHLGHRPHFHANTNISPSLQRNLRNSTRSTRRARN